MNTDVHTSTGLYLHLTSDKTLLTLIQLMIVNHTSFLYNCDTRALCTSVALSAPPYGRSTVDTWRYWGYGIRGLSLRIYQGCEVQMSPSSNGRRTGSCFPERKVTTR